MAYGARLESGLGVKALRGSNPLSSATRTASHHGAAPFAISGSGAGNRPHLRFEVMEPIYTASAVATGAGRNGHVQSTDGHLDTDVRIPKEMGGPGGATNPEQLFAAGYAACFHSALQLVAGQAKADITDSEVVADVSIGPNDAGGFGLAVQLEISLPAVERAQAEELVEQAHQVCPYSNATRGNVEVTLTVT